MYNIHKFPEYYFLEKKHNILLNSEEVLEVTFKKYAKHTKADCLHK